MYCSATWIRWQAAVFQQMLLRATVIASPTGYPRSMSLKRINIDVSMESGVLTVSGHREDETTEDLDGVKRIERLSGKFFRRFSLPESANAENITARTTNGILEVAIPKQPEVKARRITVESV
jgi:ABC-type polar amino acid transport system ATPase subunit